MRTKFKFYGWNFNRKGESNMSKHNKFKNESQDARRHDQQHSAHPDKMKHAQEKSKVESHSNKKK